jgi:arsenical pump membrane protein
MVYITIFTFVATMFLIFWRPKNINEAYPASLGAAIIIISGGVSISDLQDITDKIGGAAITIIATIVMAIVLESFGFFNWVATLIYNWTRGSGVRLFWYTNFLCFLMTLFFNNDGSILITTPILLLILNYSGLKRHEKIPYLISGALIATASSAPIGVSNIVNLIALEIIGMSLLEHTLMMFIPSTLGLIFMAVLLFLLFRKNIPKKLMITPNFNLMGTNLKHPLQSDQNEIEKRYNHRSMIIILIFVFLVRISLFVASYFDIPVAIVACIGSLILFGWRWYTLKIPPTDLLKKTPWHILLFAFSMYVIIYGLHNIGLSSLLVEIFRPIVSGSLLHASLTMGIFLSMISSLFNNHPALLIGTMAITEMGLDPVIMKTVYLAKIIGSDMGSLLLPIGTLATLIWMHILKNMKNPISWKEYIKVTVIVIPPTVLFTLLCLYLWIRIIYL